MIKVDTSKMGYKNKSDIKTPFIAKLKDSNLLFLCVSDGYDNIKAISLPQGVLQSSSYDSVDKLLEDGFEIYSGVLSVTERLA